MTIPVLPDTERRTRYTLTVASAGPFDVGFDIYGNSTDYENWVEVWKDGEKLLPVTDWTLALASGTLATAARPLTNAQITLTTASTGTIDIVGARRPRRTSQFTEGVGIPAASQNQVLTDLTAMMRETWDQMQTRVLRAPPGETASLTLPPQSERDGYFGFQGGTPAILPVIDPTSLPARVADYIHVQDFGAVGDGVTDDTAAINLALAFIRSETSSNDARKVMLTGGAYVYRVNSPLNATSIQGDHNWGIQNLRLEAHCAGKTVLDLTDSRFGTFKDIDIWGDQTDQPYNGIQQARPASTAASGTHYFENVSVRGYFTNACLHNYASEVCFYNKCKFWNYRDADVNGEAWAAIFDGAGVKACVGDFTAPLASTTQAFNLTKLTSCEFRKISSSGSAVFLARYFGLFFDACYFVANDSAHITHWCTGAERVFECVGHFEGTAPPYLVLFTGDTATNRNISGFKLVDHNPTCTTSALGVSVLTRAQIFGLDLNIRVWGVTPSNGVLDDATKYQIIGNIVAPSGMNNLSTLTGSGFIGTYRDALGTVIYMRGHRAYSDDPSALAGPSWILDRNSASPSASDLLGQLIFRGRDSAANETDYARITGQIVNSGDGTEDGRLLWNLLVAGVDTEAMRVDSNGLSVFGGIIADANRHIRLKAYTVATMPAAASNAQQMIYVSDGTSNKRMAISDGTNWRFPDGNIVS